MAVLKAVVRGIGGKLDVAEKGCDVGGVERRGYFLRVDGVRLLDGVLQNQAISITRRRMVIGRLVVFSLERFDEFRAGRPEFAAYN